VFTRYFYSTARRACLAACLLSTIAVTPGCSLWTRTKEKVKENLNMDKYRDTRARDIDERLSSPDPIVKSPF
jgi:hypothetical protein